MYALSRMEWGLLVSPYEIGTWLPLRHRTFAKCAGWWSPIAQNALHNLARIVRTALSTRAAMKTWRDKFLGCGTAFKQLSWSSNQDTGTSRKPFSPNPPRGSGGVVLWARGMEGMSSGGKFSDWYHVIETLPLETGGQVHTHKHRPTTYVGIRKRMSTTWLNIYCSVIHLIVT